MHMGWRTYLRICFLSRRLTSNLFPNSPEAAETTFSALSPFRRTFKHFQFFNLSFFYCAWYLPQESGIPRYLGQTLIFPWIAPEGKGLRTRPLHRSRWKRLKPSSRTLAGPVPLAGGSQGGRSPSAGGAGSGTLRKELHSAINGFLLHFFAPFSL